MHAITHVGRRKTKDAALKVTIANIKGPVLGIDQADTYCSGAVDGDSISAKRKHNIPIAHSCPVGKAHIAVEHRVLG